MQQVCDVVEVEVVEYCCGVELSFALVEAVLEAAQVPHEVDGPGVPGLVCHQELLCLQKLKEGKNIKNRENLLGDSLCITALLNGFRCKEAQVISIYYVEFCLQIIDDEGREIVTLIFSDRTKS